MFSWVTNGQHLHIWPFNDVRRKYSQYCNARYLFSPRLDFFIRLSRELRESRFPLKINKHWWGTDTATDHLVTTATNRETWHLKNISMSLTWDNGLSGQQLRWQGRVTTVPTLDIPGYCDDKRHNIGIHWPVSLSTHHSLLLSLATIGADISVLTSVMCNQVTVGHFLMGYWWFGQLQCPAVTMARGVATLVTMTALSQVHD